jgi:hypothetical protein
LFGLKYTIDKEVVGVFVFFRAPLSFVLNFIKEYEKRVKNTAEINGLF